MALAPLDNLVRIVQLKAEAVTQAEFDALVRSVRVRLQDAQNTTLRNGRTSYARIAVRFGDGSAGNATGLM